MKAPIKQIFNGDGVMVEGKYCRSCQRVQPIKDGKNVIMANGIWRFKCAYCREKARAAKLLRLAI